MEQDTLQQERREEQSEPVPSVPKSNGRARHSRKRIQPVGKRRWAYPLGATVLLLSLVGVIALISLTAGGISKLVKSSREREFKAYEEFIQPVVLFDPAPFAHLSEATNDELLKAAYWAAQKECNSTDKQLEMSITSDNLVRYLMPQSDIQAQARRLFGAEVEMDSFTINGVVFEYDNTEQCVYVPITSHIGVYNPDVVKVKKEGNTTILTVHYISTSAVGDQPQPEKEMLFYLSGKEGNQIITAIRNSEK